MLIPYRPDQGYRDQAWLKHVRRFWDCFDPETYEIIVQSPKPGAHPGEFNHPAAINAAAKRARGEVFLIADADTSWAPSNMPERLVAAVRYGAPWAMPKRYAQLTLPQSRGVLQRSRYPSMSPTEALLDGASWVGDSVSWAGLVCVPRAAFDTVRGYDERYAWWGADDVAFGLSLDALWGPHERVEGSALHLWHPTPLAERYGHRKHAAQQQLTERYMEAAGDPVAMRELRSGEPGAIERSFAL